MLPNIKKSSSHLCTVGKVLKLEFLQINFVWDCKDRAGDISISIEREAHQYIAPPKLKLYIHTWYKIGLKLLSKI